jgi:hypothetical protein
VLTADIAANGVSAEDIADNAVNRSQLGDNAVNAPEIGSNAVGSSELAESSVRGEEIQSEAVESADIAFDAVGKSELDSNAVGADSIVELHDHTGELGSVTDGVAHDGAYGTDTVTVSCPSTEKLVSWSLDWTDNNDHNETTPTCRRSTAAATTRSRSRVRSTEAAGPRTPPRSTRSPPASVLSGGRSGRWPVRRFPGAHAGAGSGTNP